MTDTGAVIRVPSQRRPMVGPLIGMTCAMVGALALCCAGDYIFFMYPKLNEVWTLVNVSLPSSTQFTLAYGPSLWFATAVGSIVSVGLAIRCPGRAFALVINVTMCVGAMGLAYLAKTGAMAPFLNVLLESAR